MPQLEQTARHKVHASATIVLEGVLAGVLVACVETALFWWSRDYALSPSSVGLHMVWLGGVGLLKGNPQPDSDDNPTPTRTTTRRPFAVVRHADHQVPAW